MNAHCSSLEDDLTFLGFAPPADDGSGDDRRSDHGDGIPGSMHGGFGDGFGDAFGGGYGDGFGDFDDDFDCLDPVERHGLRQMTKCHAGQLLADRVASLATEGELGADAAAAILVWTFEQQPEAVRRSLLDIVDPGADSPAGHWLAAWRAGGLSRRALRRAAGDILEAARVELLLERSSEVQVIEGPWREAGREQGGLRGQRLGDVHRLHLLRLAIRHSDLELDASGKQIAEMWLEELRAELRARLRELQAGSATTDEVFAGTTELVAASSEMWRDTAPAGKPLRLPLERLTRVAWVVAQRRGLTRAERAALLIAAANQRLDDLWSGSFEGPLYTGYAQGECPNATWIGGRRPKSASAPDARSEALVLRALAGSARTGPRRLGA